MYSFDEIIDRRQKNSAKWDSRFIGTGKEELLPFWVADTDFAAPKEVQEALRSCVEHNIYGYSLPPKGCAGAVAGWQKRRHGFSVKEEWVEFAAGIDGALSAAVCAYTKPGDAILIQTPVYAPFFETVERNGRKVLENAMHIKNGKYEPDFHDFEKKAKEAKMWMFCNPQNPTGRCFTKEELERFAAICLENDVLMLSDEIHGDIIFDDHVHIPLASLSGEICSKTITCTSAGKTFSIAGLAASAIIIADEKLRKQFSEEKEKRCINTGILGLTAMEAAYTCGDRYADRLIQYLQSNRDFALNYFNKKIPKIHAFSPEGTFLMWLDCSELMLSGKELENFFTSAGVKLSMGSAYRAGSESYARMNFACPRKLLEEGLKRIEERVLAGIQG